MTTMYTRRNGQPFDTPFRIERAIDGSRYAVFENEYDAEDFAVDVLARGDAVLVCYGSFLNAVVLDDATR